MPLLNQPFQGKNLGDLLLSKLGSSDFKELNIFSAFAKSSGVLRLKDEIMSFVKKGGKVNAFIGVDLGGTSVEALITLFDICTTLTIVHSENGSTFHSKIYTLAGDDTFWYAIGSNNLTLGGLWTNFESCYYNELHGDDPEDIQKEIEILRDRYLNPSYECSMSITSLDDINKLQAQKYILTEGTIHLHSKKKFNVNNEKNITRPSQIQLFGRQKVSPPQILKNLSQTSEQPKVFAEDTLEYKPKNTSISASSKEIFWFEMRKSTGGSRNILDLSKKGTIRFGSAVGTTYEIEGDISHSLGGVKFFGIDPSATDSPVKNLTINYKGRDYYPASILYPSGDNANGTWRIQLKGEDIDNPERDELSKFGGDHDFVDKILIFEKVRDDYYILSLTDNENLPLLKNSSKFWSTNGSRQDAKAYGFINELELEV